MTSSKIRHAVKSGDTVCFWVLSEGKRIKLRSTVKIPIVYSKVHNVQFLRSSFSTICFHHEEFTLLLAMGTVVKFSQHKGDVSCCVQTHCMAQILLKSWHLLFVTTPEVSITSECVLTWLRVFPRGNVIPNQGCAINFYKGHILDEGAPNNTNYFSVAIVTSGIYFISDQSAKGSSAHHLKKLWEERELNEDRGRCSLK